MNDATDNEVTNCTVLNSNPPPSFRILNLLKSFFLLLFNFFIPFENINFFRLLIIEITSKTSYSKSPGGQLEGSC